MLKSVESLKNTIEELIRSEYSKHKSKSTKHSRYFEERCTNLVKDLIAAEGYKIISVPKNAYPEIKFTDGEKVYAIDIKTARKNCDPQFDLCHISLYPEMNYNLFDEEWVLIVKYDEDKEANCSLIDCYFEQLHNVAGLQKTGELAGKVLSKGGHAIKCRPMSWERIEAQNFEIKDREDFLKFIRATQDLVNKDPDKAKIMKDQLERFNPSKKIDLKTELDLVTFAIKNNMNRELLCTLLKDSELLEVL